MSDWEIPLGWSKAWGEKDKCSDCNGKLITIVQCCGDMNQYEIRCLSCGKLISEHYED